MTCERIHWRTQGVNWAYPSHRIADEQDGDVDKEIKISNEDGVRVIAGDKMHLIDFC